MADDKERFRRALEFMKMLGVSNTVVAPLLRRLIKLYDNEWSLIEEENYRALADSYFEQVESRADVAKSHMVTRNRARRSGLTAGNSRQAQHKKPDPIAAQPNEEGINMPPALEIGVDRRRYKEKQTRTEKDHCTDFGSTLGPITSSSTSTSFSFDTHVDCLSYKETRADDLKADMEDTDIEKLKFQAAPLPITGMLSREIVLAETRAGGLKHMEDTATKKLKIQATPLPMAGMLSREVVLASTFVPIKVKEEPIELTNVRKNEPLLFQQSMQHNVVSQTPSFREAAVSSLHQGDQTVAQQELIPHVISTKVHEDTYPKGIGKESGLVNYSTVNGLEQKEDALSAIALTYGSMPDEDFAVVKFALPGSQYFEQKDAEAKNHVETELMIAVKQEPETLCLAHSPSFMQMDEVKAEESIWKEFIVVVKQEQESQQPAIRQLDDAKGKEPIGKERTMVVKQEPELVYNMLVPSRKHCRKNNSSTVDASSLSCTSVSVVDERSGLAIVPQHPQQRRWEDIRTRRHNLDDISRGQERVAIPVFNPLTNDTLPETFLYISKSITYQSAYVNFSLARIADEDYCGTCYGDCLKSYPPCQCARETGGEFAYDSQGRLRASLLQEAIADKRDAETISNRMWYCEMGACPVERRNNDSNVERCKGHLMRRFVKECWSKCGCDMVCGNRLVQKGIRCKLQVFFTPEGKGWGLRTLEDLPARTFVCEYVGEILTNTELDMRNSASKGHMEHYPVLLDADWGSENILKDEESLCLDATFYGNVARFINHRCYDANMVDIPVEIESPDHHYHHIAFFTTRLVKACEELTWDYCIDFEDLSHPIKAFQCLCGSQYCRGRGQKL